MNQPILILGGAPKETIDGVRYYANHARPQEDGMEVAKLLESMGAKVMLIAPDPSIISARDLVAAAEDYAKTDIKAVLHLANISSIRPAQASAQKLKVKKEAGHPVPMEVVGNVDVWARLEAAFPGVPIIGYRDNQLTANASNSFVDGLMSLIKESVYHADKSKILPITYAASPTGELSGRKIILTSGPTVEKLTLQGDVISNFSSGKQGRAIAEALAGMGAEVKLIEGGTARGMLDKVMAQLPADAFIGVAAVADFGMEKPVDLRLKDGEPYTLQLVQNPDLLQTVGQHKTLRPKVVIGFAAETDAEKLLEYARGKLDKKGADAICANQAAAIGSENNQITWVSKDGVEPWETMDKHEVGRKIGVKIGQFLQKHH